MQYNKLSTKDDDYENELIDLRKYLKAPKDEEREKDRETCIKICDLNVEISATIVGRVTKFNMRVPAHNKHAVFISKLGCHFHRRRK